MLRSEEPEDRLEIEFRSLSVYPVGSDVNRPDPRFLDAAHSGWPVDIVESRPTAG
jgi:hypothetical protein